MSRFEHEWHLIRRELVKVLKEPHTRQELFSKIKYPEVKVNQNIDKLLRLKAIKRSERRDCKVSGYLCETVVLNDDKNNIR